MQVFQFSVSTALILNSPRYYTTMSSSTIVTSTLVNLFKMAERKQSCSPIPLSGNACVIYWLK